MLRDMQAQIEGPVRSRKNPSRRKWSAGENCPSKTIREVGLDESVAQIDQCILGSLGKIDPSHQSYAAGAGTTNSLPLHQIFCSLAFDTESRFGCGLKTPRFNRFVPGKAAAVLPFGNSNQSIIDPRLLNTIRLDCRGDRFGSRRPLEPFNPCFRPRCIVSFGHAQAPAGISLRRFLADRNGFRS